MIKTLSKAQKMEREKFRIPRSVQDAIPIRRIFADGIFQVGNQYSKTWSFTDINYAIASKEDKTSMFLDYSELLNALDSGASAIFQDFIKYPFTAEENITISDLENANDLHRLSKVIDDAGAAEVIDGLPHRLQTQLQKGWNGGTELSQGQWQKIAIARCLFKQSDVYLFDEPFSALDAISEQHIIKRLNLKTKMSITIFITHRYSSLRLADFILVLKDGELVESGSHQELQKAGKYYSELIKAQIEPIDHLAQLDET